LAIWYASVKRSAVVAGSPAAASAAAARQRPCPMGEEAGPAPAHERLLEVSKRAVCVAVKQQHFAERVSERRHRLAVARLGGDARQRRRAGAEIGLIAALGEIGRRPLQRGEDVVAVVGTLPAGDEGTSALDHRIVIPVHGLHQDKAGPRVDVRPQVFDPPAEGGSLGEQRPRLPLPLHLHLHLGERGRRGAAAPAPARPARPRARRCPTAPTAAQPCARGQARALHRLRAPPPGAGGWSGGRAVGGGLVGWCAGALNRRRRP
jgi:hypothetical protein